MLNFSSETCEFFENFAGQLQRGHAPIFLSFRMISTIITLIVILGILLVFGLVLNMIKWAIRLAIIVGIIALIMHFVKKKS